MTSHRISGKTNIYGIIGDPVDHSLSPVIQNVAFSKRRLNAVYVPFHVKRPDLERAVEGLRSINVRGFNVTTPHKISIMRYLDKLDPEAVHIQSVNTVINRKGVLKGYNTDGIGALKSIRSKRLTNATVVIFGAGGAARAIAHAFAPKVATITIVNRTLSKAKQLERSIRSRFRGKLQIAVCSLHDQLISEYVRGADIIVNASSMGMSTRKPPVSEEWFHSGQIVFDIVYKPIVTELLKLAKNAGADTINGLEMLLNQGCCSFKLWTGLDPPVAVMRKILIEKLR